MELEERIAHFKNMAEADPDNELGHFSLGKAYLDARRYDEAIASFSRVTELKGDFSKAYHHLGEAQKLAGRPDEAIATLTKGHEVAARRGDLMPRDAMAQLLRELGQEPPQVRSEPAAAPEPVGGDTVRCTHCSKAGPKLAQRPFKGELGEKIWANICQTCWKEWLAMGTKVINELQLDFSNPKASEMYDSHMKEFLQLE